MLKWTYDAACPDDWPELLDRCGGGFFHSPIGLLAGAPPGAPLFARCTDADALVAVAVGVRQHCRFSLGARHVYFPTLPAVHPDADRPHVLATLVHRLRRLGAAEVEFDSFDASWTPEPSASAETTECLEFVVKLQQDDATLASGLGAQHRAQIERGEREGWLLRSLQGEQAQSVLQHALGGTARGGDRLGRGWHPARPYLAIRAANGQPRDGWGSTAYAAWRDGALAAALIGWANRTACYVIGGPTPAGQEQCASAWLHWQIMRALRARGFARYNLGGTPLLASHPEHPAHALYRFKSGFGGERVTRRTARWTLSPAHLTAHRALRWAASSGIAARSA